MYFSKHPISRDPNNATVPFPILRPPPAVRIFICIFLALLFIPFVTPAARAQEETVVFGDNCSLTVERELQTLPFDNFFKYSTLLILATSPELGPIALAAGKMGQEAAFEDVIVATLKGVVNCIRDPAQRQEWRNGLIVALALKDVGGFMKDLYSASGLFVDVDPNDAVKLGERADLTNQFFVKIGLSPSIASSLGESGDILRVAAARSFKGLPLSFQMATQVKMRIGTEFVQQCQMNTARQITQNMRAAMLERHPSAIREMVTASRAFIGQAIPVPDLMFFNAVPYLNTHANDVSKFMSARGDVRLIDRLLPESKTLLEKIRTTTPLYKATHERLLKHLDDAEGALRQCNYPRMISNLKLVSLEPGVIRSEPFNTMAGSLYDFFVDGGTEQRLGDTEHLQRSLAESDGCWGDVVSRYNAIIDKYDTLGDINVKGRDDFKLDAAFASGMRALDSCDKAGAQRALDSANSLMPEVFDPGDLCLDPVRAQNRVSMLEDRMSEVLPQCPKIPVISGDPPDGDATGRHVLKLVTVNGPRPRNIDNRNNVEKLDFSGSGVTVSHEKEGQYAEGGLSHIDRLSYGFDNYPTAIELGKSFSFGASLIMQRDVVNGGCSGKTRQFPVRLGMWVNQKNMIGLKNVGMARPDVEYTPACDASYGVGGEASLAVVCTPVSGAPVADISNYRLLYFYDCSGTGGGSEKSQDRLYLAWPIKDDGEGGYVTAEERMSPEYDWAFDYRAILSAGPLRGVPLQPDDISLTYEPDFTYPSGRRVSFGTVEHTVTVNNTWQGAQTADAAETGDNDAGSTAAAGDAAGQTASSDDRRAHIQNWLALAQPVENANPGYNLDFDEWGRVKGTTPTGTITLSGKPDGAGTSTSEYAWTRAESLDSLNMCTLQVYVDRKLAGEETESCQKSITQDDNAMPDLAGMEAARARTKLNNMGVDVEWRPGSIPTGSAKQGTIEKQSPEVGASLEDVKKVKLWVYRKSVISVTVPDVEGMPYDDARTRLREAGLSPRLGRNVELRPGTREGTVSYQDVRAGEAVTPGATVTLNVHGSAGVVGVPSVAGQKYDQAVKLIEDAGLKAKRRIGPYAPSMAKANTVQKTYPPAGTRLDAGTDVTLIVYNIYSEKIQTADAEPSARDTKPDGGPGPVKQPPARFNCDAGNSGIMLNGRPEVWGLQGLLRFDHGKVEGEYYGQNFSYFCHYLFPNYQQLNIKVSFYLTPPESSADKAKKDIFETYCNPPRKSHVQAYGVNGKAVKITYLDDYARRIGPAAARQLNQFHLDQILPYATSCR